MGMLRRFFAALVVLGLASVLSLPGDVLGYQRAEASDSDRALEGTQRWKELIGQAADESGVPREVIAAIMAAEPGGEVDWRSTVDGRGLMGLRPKWQPSAAALGSELEDPSTNIRAAARVLSKGYAAWGSWNEAAAAYAGLIDTQGNLVNAEDGTDAGEYLARFQRSLAQLGYLDSIEQPQSASRAESSIESAIPERITGLKHALSALGTPYVYGGDSYGDGGFDCSGLMQWAYERIGKTLPRSAAAQWRASTQIDRSQIVPGDLIFFANTYMSGISHVAMYAGDGLMIHAPRASEPVKLTPLTDSYWQSHIFGFGRVQ